MGKKETKGTTTKVVVLSPEELQKLSPEDLMNYASSLGEKAATLQSSNTELAAKVKEATKDVLPSFDVDADEEHDIEGGTYQFTCPTFHWDDNRIIDVRELMAETESKDKKVAEAAQAILGHLVARKSGIIARKED
jgi:hypothetical protein